MIRRGWTGFAVRLQWGELAALWRGSGAGGAAAYVDSAGTAEFVRQRLGDLELTYLSTALRLGTYVFLHTLLFPALTLPLLPDPRPATRAPPFPPAAPPSRRAELEPGWTDPADSRPAATPRRCISSRTRGTTLARGPRMRRLSLVQRIARTVRMALHSSDEKLICEMPGPPGLCEPWRIKDTRCHSETRD